MKPRLAAIAGLAAGLVAACASPAPLACAEQSVIVVIGAPGTDEYGKAFHEWAENWREAAAKGDAKFTLIGAPGVVHEGASFVPPSPPSDSPVLEVKQVKNDAPLDDRTQLQNLIAAHAKSADENATNEKSPDVLWIVFIGHGSFDGETAKFNLRGPDASISELAQWLAAVKSPVALIDCTSASAPLINAASAKNRVVIAATKSGHEQNYARFGDFLAKAIADAAADLDKDGQTSLLEAYLTACRGVAEFYESDARLATEHALLDDNGDGLGTPAAWFRGLRATQRAKEGASLDGLRAHQIHLVRSDRELHMPAEVRARRDALELSIAGLRDRKTELGDDAYYAELEPLMLELANLYANVEPAPPAAEE